MDTTAQEKAILLFDGVCNLCNASVNFVIKRDTHNRFLFASLQSETGKQLVKKFSLSESLDSFVLIENGIAYTRSIAALRVLKKLGGIWSLSFVFMIVPSFIRNGVYNFVSRNRYRWFGKKESCMIPTAELKKKFLE
jgi:predicted DCC family thiol-disulfide oxidoreductase YuxK